MDRQRLEAAICSYNEQTEKRYMRFQFPEEMKESKLQKFLEKYAPEVKREEVVAVCDSLDKVVLTEEYLYSKKLKEKKVVFKGLRKVAPIQLTYGEADEGVLILYWDGTVIRGGLKELRVLEKLFPFLEDVAEKRPEEVPVCSQEEFRELHRRFGRQLRKELTRAAAECSEKMKFFYLSSHFTREKIEEGIRICGAVIRPEDVLAMSYSTLIKESEVVLLTEYGLFSASGKYRWEIPFEGMEIVESDELLLLYQTGPFRSPWIPEAEEGVRMLLHKAVGIYQGAIGEMSSPAKDFSLNLIDGWKEFTSQRKWGLLEGRKNSIFVSSTFKDMHYERDAIHEQVLPILNQAGSKYGQSLSFCDLRWGVNTGELDSEEGARKVLSVCLEEIERCEPYMLVILGERYGWIPEKELIARTVEEYRRDGMEGLEELEQSVTALEIEFGSLSRADHMDRTLFYFRQIEGTPSAAYLSEDSHHAEKLQKLKERIVKLSGGKVRTYTLKWDEEEGRPTGLDAFAEMVTADVLAMMSVEWEKAEKLTPLEKEISAQWSLARRRALQCSARESLIQSILNLLEEGEGLIALQGVSGSGKSTLMGCLAMVLSLSGADVLPLFCGHTAQSDTAQEIMEIMTEFLAVRLKDTVPLDEEEEDLCNRLNQLAARYQEVGEKQVIFLIDALDLLPPDSLRDELKLLPEKLFGKVRAIVSCTETFPLSSVRCIVALPLLGEAQRQEVIKGILASMHRETEQSVIRAIGQKKASESPLYISLLLQRMLMMNKADFDQIMERGDGMSAITARQLELVEQASDTLPGICRELLDSAAARIGGDLSREVIKYLTVSRHGLRESDLERLLTERGISWSALDFSLFINYIRGMFLQREDGRYDFAHKNIREGILELITEEKERHGEICRLLGRLAPEDTVRRQEWMYHCCIAEDKEMLRTFILENGANNREEMKQVTKRELLHRAARDVAGYCDRDGGAFLCRILSELENEEEAKRFLYFVYDVLYTSLGGTENYDSLRERICQCSIETAERLLRPAEITEHKMLLSLLYYLIGKVYGSRGGEQALAQAFAWQKKSLLLTEEVCREGSAGGKRDLAVQYWTLGDLHMKSVDFTVKKQAAEYYEKSLPLCMELAEERKDEQSRSDLALIYEKIGEFYENGTEGWQPEKAEEAYRKQAGIREEILVERKSGKAYENLTYAYKNLAFLYEWWEKPGNLQLAAEFYEKAIAPQEKAVRENPGYYTQWQLAHAYRDLGRVCEKLEGEEYLKKAVLAFEHGISYWELCVREKELFRDRKNLAWVQLHAAKVLKRLGGAEHVARACELQRAAIPVYEMAARQEDTTEAYEELYHALAGAFGGAWNGDETTEYYRKLLDTAELLYARTKSERYKKVLKEMKKGKLAMKLYGKVTG